MIRLQTFKNLWNKYAPYIVICGTFALVGIIRSFPYSENTFYLIATFESIARVMMGFGALPLARVYGSSPIYILLLILMGFVYTQIYFAWSSKKWGAVVGFASPFALNSLCGIYIALFSIPGQFLSSCEHVISPTTRIRVAQYEQGGGSQIFFSATTDSGQHWLSFIDAGRESSADIDRICKQPLRSLNNQFYWMWFDWKFAVTHDGGATWEVWTSQETWPNQYPHSYIRDVVFQNVQIGRMSVLSPTDVGTDPLYTDDGGLTWHE